MYDYTECRQTGLEKEMDVAALSQTAETFSKTFQKYKDEWIW